MNQNENPEVRLRPKRQITLPSKVCEKLGLGYGDKLELKVNGNRLIATPKKNIAGKALEEIRSAFKKSGISEDELIETQEKIRHSKSN